MLYLKDFMNITLVLVYIMAFILIQHKYYLKVEVLKEYKDLREYRLFELIVFYCQIFALLLYLSCCKFFRYLKMKLNKWDPSDPFQHYLSNDNTDFLENNSPQMRCIMTFSINILLSSYMIYY